MPERHAAAPVRVSVVIVTYRNETTIEACLASLAEQTTVPFEAVVVDNSPDEATWDRLADYRRRHPGTDVLPLRPGTNLGFAAACNLGARAARGDFLVFLNPDTTLQNDILSHFLAFWRDHPDAGLLGPQVRDEHGQTTRTCRNLPSLSGILLDATGLDRMLGAYRLMHFAHDQTRRVPQIIGACLFTSRQRFAACGGFDERFFIYFEEVDLCKRLAEAGQAIWFLPEARIAHAAGTSCESTDSVAAMVARLRQSRLGYFRKHFPPTTAMALAGINALEGAAKAAVLLGLYAATGRRRLLEKAKGFWRVATCLGCWR